MRCCIVQHCVTDLMAGAKLHRGQNQTVFWQATPRSHMWSSSGRGTWTRSRSTPSSSRRAPPASPQQRSRTRSPSGRHVFGQCSPLGITSTASSVLALGHQTNCKLSMNCVNLAGCYLLGIEGIPAIISQTSRSAMHRCVQNADIHMADVFVPDSARLAGVNSFQDTTKAGAGGSTNAA